MNKLILVFLASLVFTYSCNNSKNKDLSYHPEKYKELGMPDYTKIWTEDDYGQATNALYNIRAQYPNSLPRFKSKKSGVYFDRITNINNLYFLHDDSIPLGDKAYHIQMYFGAQTDLVKIYTNILTKKQYYHRELIEVNRFSLRIMEEMLILADIIMHSDDPIAAGLRHGLQAIQYQYLIKINQIFKMQSDFETYSVEDLERLSSTISRSLLKNSTWMTADTKDELRRKISELISNAPSDTIKNNLKEAHESL